MRKLFVIASVATCLSLAGADEAKAAGPFYIYFTDYCDCITVQRGTLLGHKWYFGTWDWECLGTSSTLIHGEARDAAVLGTQPIDSNGVPAGFSATFDLENISLGSGHSHVTATYDGVTNVEVVEEGDYFMRTGPPCPTSPNPSGKPRIFPAQ